MFIVKIRGLIWNGKRWGQSGKRCVGIAERDLKQDNDSWIGVEIGNKNADGSQMYPGTFRILKDVVGKFQTDRKKGVLIYITPIEALQKI